MPETEKVAIPLPTPESLKALYEKRNAVPNHQTWEMYVNGLNQPRCCPMTLAICDLISEKKGSDLFGAYTVFTEITDNIRYGFDKEAGPTPSVRANVIAEQTGWPPEFVFGFVEGFDHPSKHTTEPTAEFSQGFSVGVATRKIIFHSEE